MRFFACVRGRASRIAKAFAGVALLLATTAISQNTPQSSPTPQSPEIRVATRLVQVNVLVHDKNGPVADLTKDDFTLLDQGKPQNISVFSMESSVAGPQNAQPLPQNTFSDLPQYGASALRSVTIVLLDNLNTLAGNGHEDYQSDPYWMEDSALANAKAHLIEFIKNLDPKDRVAIYGLSDTLHVLCDFTGDRDRLLSILQKYDTSSRTQREAVEPGKFHTPVPGRDFNADLGAQALASAGMENQRRSEETMAALQAIAGHVANIPGRKNLVWLTGNLPFSGTVIARILSPAQIAAYPVDGRALLSRAPLTSEEALLDAKGVSQGDFMPAQAPMPIGIDTMRQMARETGGLAFVNTNDLTGAIRRAVEDSAVIYTLGIYLEKNALDGKFHEIKVQVNRTGLNVRYPTGYYALKDTPASEGELHSSFLSAILSPLDSSSIPVQVKATRVDRPTPKSLSLFGTIGIQDIHLAQSGEMRVGAVDIIIIQQDETGKVLRESTNRLDLRFTAEKYAAILKTGINFNKTVQPEAATVTLRVIVQDPSTAIIGSLIIPLSQIQ
jgi:VWFA-related protein